MNPVISYDIRAEAFRRMTGHMAPGKDAAPESYPASYEIRNEAWNKWNDDNAVIIRFMLLAASEFID